MDDKVKKISEEMLEYYRKHIYECPIDILRVLYAEKDADFCAANQIIGDQLDLMRDLERQIEIRDTNFCAANQIVGEQLDIIKELKRKIEIKDRYCDLIWCLGVDYDGYETLEGLKSLIDELVALAKKAVKNDDQYTMYEGCGDKYYNILNKEVPKPKEEE